LRQVGVSFFEVYRGLVLDLLGGCSRCEVREDGDGTIHVVGLREVRSRLSALDDTSAGAISLDCP
jgi:hypothetical protein